MDKTERTILLDPGNRTLSIVLTLIFFVTGAFHVINGQSDWIRAGLGIVMIVLSIFYGLQTALAHSRKSKYAPRVRVTHEQIELKNSFWKKAQRINWSEVKGIHFENYKIDFELSDGAKAFSYNTKAEQSKELKRMLREFAATRDIEVIGG